jgi:hypothetical protein
MTENKKEIIRSIRLTSDLHKQICQKAKEENRSFNNMVETLLLNQLQNE